MTQTELERLARIEEKVDNLIRAMETFMHDTQRNRDKCDLQFRDHENRLRALEMARAGVTGGFTMVHKALVVLATLCSIAAFLLALNR
jgi:hypothetical protein